MTSHIDSATKSTYPMMMSLLQDLNFTYVHIFERISQMLIKNRIAGAM